MILGIYGSGATGREVLELSERLNTQSRFESIVFIDDVTDEKTVGGIDVFSFDAFKSEFAPGSTQVVIGAGEPRVRALLWDKTAAAGYSFATLIAPDAIIYKDAVIGEGAVVCYNAIVSFDTVIENNVYIQPSAFIGHNCVVGEHSVISSFDVVSGHASVGKMTYIGLSVPIKEGVKVGSKVIISMGSVVVRDIPDGMIAVGNPARVMKENTDEKVFR